EEWLISDGCTSLVVAVCSPRPLYPDCGYFHVLRVSHQAELTAHPILDGPGDRGILLHGLFDVLAALTEAFAAEGEPRPALLDDLAVDSQIEQVPFLRDPLAVHDVELGFAKWRGYLVLDHLDARTATDDLVAVLDRAD